MIRIVIMSYRELTDLINKLDCAIPSDVQLSIVEALMEDALQKAQQIEQDGQVDVFVSAGGNAAFLSDKIKTPLVTIPITGVGVLQALVKAKKYSNTAAIITYRNPLTYIEQIMPVLNMKIKQITYSDLNDVPQIMDNLTQEKATSVIGGSLAIEHAQRRGISSHFIYSDDGVMQAIKEAINLGRAIETEAAKTEKLRMIMDFTHEGIVSTNKNGVIIEFNQSAEKITGISRKNAIGHQFNEFFSSKALDKIKNKKSDLLQVQNIGATKILTNCVPVIPKDEVVGMITTFQDVTEVQKAEQKIRERLHKKGFVAKTTFADITGKSEIMLQIKDLAEVYAQSDSTIIIEGQSGTGKELFAQAIHNRSKRSDRPFIAINCAALPESLLESELFGYAEGAFTGAKKGGKSGLFELAHGGSIFLDEIGEMHKSIQTRLLRVLQEHEVLRIGGEQIIPVDIRVIAATNKNLWEMVQSGAFREDLYYRLSVLEVHLPKLCQRVGDIPLLITQFLKEFRPDLSKQQIHNIAHHPVLLKYAWPGNIRQLRNIVERISILYNGTKLDSIICNTLGAVELSNAEKEQRKLIELLEECKGNKAEVARRLGISRVTLWRKLNK